MNQGIIRYVFYANRLYGTYPLQQWIEGRHAFETPDGAYLLLGESGAWYLKQFSNFTPLNLRDVPPELKTLCLLLGIQI